MGEREKAPERTRAASGMCLSKPCSLCGPCLRGSLALGNIEAYGT